MSSFIYLIFVFLKSSKPNINTMIFISSYFHFKGNYSFIPCSLCFYWFNWACERQRETDREREGINKNKMCVFFSTELFSILHICSIDRTMNNGRWWFIYFHGCCCCCYDMTMILTSNSLLSVLRARRTREGERKRRRSITICGKWMKIIKI